MKAFIIIIITILYTGCYELTDVPVVAIQVETMDDDLKHIWSVNGVFVRENILMTNAHAIPVNYDKIKIIYKKADELVPSEVIGDLYEIDYFMDLALIEVPLLGPVIKNCSEIKVFNKISMHRILISEETNWMPEQRIESGRIVAGRDADYWGTTANVDNGWSGGPTIHVRKKCLVGITQGIIGKLTVAMKPTVSDIINDALKEYDEQYNDE